MAWPIPEHLWPAYREAFRIYSELGGRASTFELTFLVRDGLIVRAGAYARLDVPPRHAGDDDGYGLIAKVVSMPQLSRDGESIHLEDDPDYVVVRPGGCEPCMEATLVYSDHAPQEKVRRVAMIEPTCLAGPRNCTTVEDLLPASAPFHLYDGAIGARPEATTVQTSPNPHPCAVPVWALGRDTTQIVLAEALSASGNPSEPEQYDIPGSESTIRVLETLRGQNGFGPNDVITVFPYTPMKWDKDFVPERMIPGKHYFLLGFRRTTEEQAVKLTGLPLERCSVLPATPAVRAELKRGAQLNDQRPVPELEHFPF